MSEKLHRLSGNPAFRATLCLIGNHQELSMKIKTAFVAMVLALSPALASAGCWMGHQTSASACGEGMVWDEPSQTCIAPISS